MGNVFQLANPTQKPRYIPKNNKPEEAVQKQVCSYLRKHHPTIIFRSDYASGLKLTKNQAAKHKSLQSSRGFPDLFVYYPVQHGERKYCGLALELKAEGTSVILKIGERKGKLSTDPHIQEQAVMLKELNRVGYYANFAVGYDEAISIIEWYMKTPRHEAGSLF
jgi:hypothetical protein